MFVVGVTGGIGSGKSTVCKILSSIGYPVFYADNIAKQILVKNTVIGQIVDLFGDSILNENGFIERSKLAQIVFADQKKLNLLNKVVHKEVAIEFANWSKNQLSNIIFKEAAILFESGSNVGCDFVVNIASPAQVRMQRVLKRDDRTEQEVQLIMNKQWVEDERFKMSDFTIDNYNQKLLPQVLSLQEILLKRVDNVVIMP